MTNVTAARPAPGRPYQRLLLAYLVYLAVAELAVTIVSPLLVFPLHGGLVVLTAIYLARTSRRARWAPEDPRVVAVALALSVAPLIRIISLTLPLPQLEPPLRYAAAGIPMLLGGALAARAAGFSARRVGIAWQRPGWQLITVLASVGIGFAEFAILQPAALGPLPWTPDGAIPALSVGILTGLPEELIFRGVMQSALRPIIGRWNWIYVSGAFAVLHIGYHSYLDVVFVFVVGLFYGWIFERTRSILGVAVGHSVTNIVLFFVAPHVVTADVLVPLGAVAELQLAVISSVVLALGCALFWWSRVEVSGAPADG